MTFAVLALENGDWTTVAVFRDAIDAVKYSREIAPLYRSVIVERR
jgi:hypothetical protein